MTHHVYILYSKSRDRYHTGFTNSDLTERIQKHNSSTKGIVGGNSNDWELRWSLVCESGAIAKRFEAIIKGWKSRKMIEQLIQGEIPIE